MLRSLVLKSTVELFCCQSRVWRETGCSGWSFICIELIGHDLVISGYVLGAEGFTLLLDDYIEKERSSLGKGKITVSICHVSLKLETTALKALRESRSLWFLKNSIGVMYYEWHGSFCYCK